MTKPTLTYSHKFLSDLTHLTEVWEGTSETWTEGAGIDLISILAGDITPLILHGDILQIELVCNNAATVESGLYSYPDKAGVNDLDFSTTLWPSVLYRYKTSAGSAGVHAKVVAAFDTYDNAKTVETNIGLGQAQLLLDDAYSTTWKTATATLTPGETLDHILLFAECDHDTPNATYYVYYDFVLVHKGTFEFPFVAPGGVTLQIPPKTVEIGIWGRDGGILQGGGIESPHIHLEGNMDTNAAWGTPSGAYLYQIIRGAFGDYHDPWQWFTSSVINCKVKPVKPGLIIKMVDEAGVVRKYSMDFLLHSLSSLGEADWDSLGWAGLTPGD